MNLQKKTHACEELCEIITKVTKDKSNSEAKLYFDYMFYIEMGLIFHNFNSPTKEGASKIIEAFFIESDKLSDLTTLRKKMFPEKFVNSPFFLYVAMTKGELEKLNSTRATETINMLQNLYEYYDLCQAHKDSYSIHETYTKNMQRLFNFCLQNNIKIEDRETPARSKQFLRLNNTDDELSFMGIIS